jgi:hypothetical protein
MPSGCSHRRPRGRSQNRLSDVSAVVGRTLGRVVPPAPAVRDPPEFLHVDVGHVPRGVSFIAAVGGPGRADPCPGDRVRVPQPRHSVTGENPGDGPCAGAASQGQIRRAPSRRSTRLVRTSATTFAGVACGHDFGLELRSSRPSHPWVRYRLIQRWAQVREMPISLATWATGLPLRTRSTRIRLPAGVRRALLEKCL